MGPGCEGEGRAEERPLCGQRRHNHCVSGDWPQAQSRHLSSLVTGGRSKGGGEGEQLFWVVTVFSGKHKVFSWE